MAKDVSDTLLSAASLLFTVVGILYGMWYESISATLKTKVEKFAENNVKSFIEVSHVLWGRALPLIMLAAPLGFVFLPDAVTICVQAWSQVGAHGLSAWHAYDSIRTAFCLVVSASLVLGVHTAILGVRLLRLRSSLKVPSPRSPRSQ